MGSYAMSSGAKFSPGTGRAANRISNRRCMSASPLEPFGDPNLDDGLTRHAEAVCFAIKGFDHPNGEVHVDALLVAVGAWGSGGSRRGT